MSFPEKSLGDDIRAALITPDGRKLLVLTSVLRVIDTETGEEIQRSSPDIGAVPVDMAVSQDSRRAFILSPSAQRVIASTYRVPCFREPSGGFLAEANTRHRGRPQRVGVRESDKPGGGHRPVTVTPLGSVFSVNGLPGRLAFTADGQRAIAVNRQSRDGRPRLYFDLGPRAP